MEELHASAFVLRSVDYGESDRIVTFFTREHGKLPAFARAARKSQRRFGGALEPFQRLRIRFRDRRGDLASLASATIEEGRPSLLADYDLIARASYLTELVTEATREREAHPELFDLLDRGFDLLASPAFAAAPTPKREAWRCTFELKLLDLAGYRPVLDACAMCGTTEAARFRFAPERGAVLCGACAMGSGGVPVSAGTLRLLQAALDADLTRLDRLVFSPDQLDEARALLGAFLRWQLGKELKSAKFLER